MNPPILGLLFYGIAIVDSSPFFARYASCIFRGIWYNVHIFIKTNKNEHISEDNKWIDMD